MGQDGVFCFGIFIAKIIFIFSQLETTRSKFNEICSLKDYLEESLRIAQATIEKNNLINNNSVEDLQQVFVFLKIIFGN